MEEHIIAERYARALSHVVHKDEWDAAVDQLITIDTLFTDHEKTMYYFVSPVIPYDSKVILLDKILACGQFLHAVESFFYIILQKGRVLLLPLMTEALKTIIQEERNMARARIRSSSVIDHDEQQEIIDKLSSWSGKNLEYHFEYDSSLIAGFIVEVGHVIYDCSLKNKLDTLSATLQKSR